jgi:2-dehydro-3-deoxygluconokinase
VKVSTVVDSTAAGDSFNAGFIAARLKGANLRDAVHAGSSLAAQVIAKFGALVEVDVSRIAG